MVQSDVAESYGHNDCRKFVYGGGLADSEVDGMRQYVYHMVTLPQIARQKHHLNIRHSERCFLRLYFELTTVHFSRAMHRPALLNYATTLAWREANTFLALALLNPYPANVEKMVSSY